MPLIEVSAVESRFADDDVARRLVAAITDAACEVLGEQTRGETWVIVRGVATSRWGIAGEVRA